MFYQCRDQDRYDTATMTTGVEVFEVEGIVYDLINGSRVELLRANFEFHDKDDSSGNQNYVRTLAHPRDCKLNAIQPSRLPYCDWTTPIWVSQALRCDASSVKGFRFARCPRISSGVCSTNSLIELE